MATAMGGTGSGGTDRQAATRAVRLPQGALLQECREEFLVAGGPGGQHRNKTASGVRLTHLPTGVVATATERRSQARNRAAAIERLRERLEDLARVPAPRRPTKPSRAAKQRRLEAKKHRARRKAERRAHD